MRLHDVLLLTALTGFSGWITLIVLVAVGALAPGTALGAAVLVLALAVLATRSMLRRVQQLRAALRDLGDGLDNDTVITLGPPFDAVVGDIQRLRRQWTERQAALEEQAANALAQVDRLPDPVVTLDAQDRVMFANAAAEALLAGNGTPSPIGRTLSTMLRQPDLLDATAAVAGGASERQVTFTLPGAVDRVFEARVMPVAVPEGGDRQVLMAARDITAARRSEGMRADFVANVSHELRTPLASLLGFIETLRGPAEADPDARRRFLELMDAQAHRMARLVDDLLSLSHIELNELTAPADRVPLLPLLQTTSDLLGPQATQRNMQIEISAPHDLPVVIGDADDLSRLFQNLIENALKYGGDGTAVRITVSAADHVVTIAVADTGPGIAPEHLPRLTERFYRVDAARSRELGGTGLGLAIVKHIVNRHRGRLEIESRVGSGSVFRVVLPTLDSAQDHASVT